MLKELSKKERILKEMENRIKSPYITIDDDVRNILSYLYDHTSRDGKIYMSMSNIISECNLFHLVEDDGSKPASDIIFDRVEAIKDILFELEWDVLDSIEDLIGVTDEHYEELMSLDKSGDT